jgi:hypothetical protein
MKHIDNDDIPHLLDELQQVLKPLSVLSFQGLLQFALEMKESLKKVMSNISYLIQVTS